MIRMLIFNCILCHNFPRPILASCMSEPHYHLHALTSCFLVSPLSVQTYSFSICINTIIIEINCSLKFWTGNQELENISNASTQFLCIVPHDTNLCTLRFIAQIICAWGHSYSDLFPFSGLITRDLSFLSILQQAMFLRAATARHFTKIK